MRFIASTRTRTAPSGYSKVRTLFHTLRTLQLLSSMVVAGIMLFFIYHLTHDHWATPWTFVVLTTVSLLTMTALLITILLHCFVGLNPLYNLATNGILAVIWAMGFSMLAYFMWGTLTNYCDIRHWNDGAGIMVCRIYKAVFTFGLLGLVSTIGALVLDVHIRRLAQRGGRHMRLDDLDQKHARGSAPRGAYTDVIHGDRLRSEVDFSAERGDEEGLDVPDGGRFSELPAALNRQGYSVPENQFDYDTSYGGKRI